MSGSPRLSALTARLRELNAAIAHSLDERATVREDMARERLHIQQEQADIDAALEPKIVACWDEGMSKTDIGIVLNCSPADVMRILNKWRDKQGIKVRRGHAMRERDTMGRKRGNKHESHRPR